MEEFLTDYIQMIAEAQDIELDESTLQEIVNSIAANEVVWDVLDEHINYEFDEREASKKYRDLFTPPEERK